MENLLSLLFVLLAFIASYWLRFDGLQANEGYLLVLMLGLLLASVVLPATGAYRREFRFAWMRKARRLLAGWALVVMAMIVLAALFKVSAVYSRIWFGYWAMLGAFGLMISQALVYLLQWRLKASGSTRRKMVLLGAGDAAARVERRLTARDDHALELVARFGLAWGPEPVQDLSALAAYLQNHEVDDVWLAVPLDNTSLLEQALKLLKDSLVDVYVVPDLHQYRMLNQSISEWAGLPIINLSGTPMTGAEMALKNLFDRLGAFALILSLAPLLLLLALLVRLSGPGPVLFRQMRHGFGGETIEVLKFRSMRQHQEHDGKVTQARLDDDRVTGVGRWLRRSSLDELPQLFNVLKGEMSLVGPRPHALEHNQLYNERIPRYMLRHKVRPGITGWAQVNGFRGLTESDEKMTMRIEHDLWYIQNWSLWLDIQILLRTPFVMIGRNAF